MEKKELEAPLNTNERYLYGINTRLDILIDMMSSFLEAYSKEEDVTKEEETYEEVYVFEDDEEDAFDYNSLTVAELREELDIHGVYNTSSMLKSELISQAEKYL